MRCEICGAFVISPRPEFEMEVMCRHIERHFIAGDIYRYLVEEGFLRHAQEEE